MVHLSPLSFRRHTCPKGPQRYRPPYWLCRHRFVPVDRSFFYVLRHTGFNDTDLRPGFSACPDFAVHRCRLLLTPPSTWFSRVLACAYFSLTTIGPACPTTWRPPIRGVIVFCSRCALYAFWYLSLPLPAVSFRSGCRTVVIWCLRVCLVCAFLLAITTDSARLPSFRRPNRDDIVSFGFVQRVPPLLPPPIPSASVHSGCRIVIVMLF